MEKELTQTEQPQKMVDIEQIKEAVKKELQAFYEYCQQVEMDAKREKELVEEEGPKLH